MTVLAIIEGHSITIDDAGVVRYSAKAAIDGDGSGSSHGDPDFQPDTSLHFQGKALNADLVPYIAVPPRIINGVEPIVLGCSAIVSYKGKRVSAVVGDIGPKKNLGEISIACAEALGIPSSPISGGVDFGVDYEIHPGVRATVNGITYDLQAS